MTDDVIGFCESVDSNLEALQGRVESLKLNIGTTSCQMHAKLAELSHRNEGAQHSVTQARRQLEEWFKLKESESQSTIARWVQNHETGKLAARAGQAEECTASAFAIAQASIDTVERLVLEAIVARRDAEAVTVDDPEARPARTLGGLGWRGKPAGDTTRRFRASQLYQKASRRYASRQG